MIQAFYQGNGWHTIYKCPICKEPIQFYLPLSHEAQKKTIQCWYCDHRINAKDIEVIN